MTSMFENIRYKQTTCVIFGKDDITQSSIRKVKITHALWTRMRTVKGKRCCFNEMNLNAYVLNEPTIANQFKNELASKIMGFLILGPCIIFSSNGFNFSRDNVESLDRNQDTNTEPDSITTNTFDLLACSDED
jgi:aryl-phospho-beta-D-glucosidase BglC (GH1 family)